jgi:hypothetical protein
VETDLANDNADEANRASITNKHDKARLLHAALWSAAHQGKNRTQLDDHDGHMVQYVLLILLQVFSMILLTSMQILALFLIELIKVVVISLR